MSQPESVESLLKDWPPHMRLPEKYRDGAWWCIHRPGCGIACCGHATFTAAVRASVKNIRRAVKVEAPTQETPE